MKKIRNVIYVVILCLCVNITQAQVSFELDSLKISHVTWMCPNNVVITHFAYGPHLRMLFSIKNNGTDTITLRTKDLNVCIESSQFEGVNCKETFVELQDVDSLIVIPPNSAFKFRGANDLVVAGEETVDLNYRKTDFLPFLTRMLKDAAFVLTISEQQIFRATVRNCYVAAPFFVDGTFNESIFSPEY